MDHAAAFPSAPCPPPDGRVPRHKVFLPAEIVDAAGTRRIHLLNLSLTGALAHGDPGAATSMAVQIRCNAVTWSARIVWVNGNRFGIAHTVPLASATVTALIAGP